MRRFLVLEVVLFAVLAAISPGSFSVRADGCFHYPDFSSTNGLAVIHDAFVTTNSVLRLTSSTGNQTGTAWYSSKAYCAAGFTSTFQFQITNPGGLASPTPGGDGISFGLQNASLTADPNETSTATNGFGISFNTFFDPGYGEVSGDFVGVCTNGENWITEQDLSGGPIQLKDGNVHEAVIQYDGTNLSVTIDGLAAITNYSVSLAPALDASGMAWVGFGARTGGAWENHDILNWTFCVPQLPPPSVAPVITNQPASLTLPAGDTASFSVLAGGTGPLGYQWEFGGVPLAGATDSSLTITNIAATNAGDYSVVVSNAFGSVASSSATLAVETFSGSNCVNYPNFSSTNGLDIIHDAFVTTNSVLRLTTSTGNQAGTAWYTTKVYCAQGFSSTFQFQITDPGGVASPTPGADGISFSLQNASLNLDPDEVSTATNGFGISFNTFQYAGEISGNFVGICTNGENWLLERDLGSQTIQLKDGKVHTASILYDGSRIAVSIDDFTVITNYLVSLAPALDANGMAWVGFGARTGDAWENHDILSWNFCSPQPSSESFITTQPASQTVTAGANAAFSVIAGGPPPLAYQWLFGGTPISGATNSSLSLANIAGTNAGEYSVIVSNASGSLASSNAALVLFASPFANCIAYPSFSSTNGLDLLRNASVTSNATLRLTAAAVNQVGTAWYGTKVFCAQGFISAFQFQISDLEGIPYGTPGGNGISFGVQNAGPDQNPLEYAAAHNGFAVSLNTQQAPGEVSGNSVGLCTNGMNWLLQQDLDGSPVQLKDGRVHSAVIRYDGTNVSVSIDDIDLITNYRVNLAPALDANGMAWVGFGAGTAAYSENHDILSWSFCSPQAPPPSQVPVITNQPANLTVLVGGTATFSVLADGPGSLGYQWEFGSVPIAEGTDSSFTITNVGATNAGSYSVVVSNAFGSVLSSNATLTVETLSGSNCVSYPDFSSTNGLDIIHDAFVTTNSVLRLTSSTGNQTGTAWYSTKVYCAAGFTSSFQFQITDLGGLSYLPAGADGISFGLQNSSLTTDPNETSTAINGFGISFNTFFDPGFNEVSGDFVGLCTNGENWITEQDLSGGPIQLKDGRVHAAIIQYDGTNLSVTIDGLAVITSYPVSLSPALDASGMAWVGFGARTGGAWENHDILNWTFCAPQLPPPSQLPFIQTQPAGQTVTAGAMASFAVVAGGLGALGYQWEFGGVPLAGATDSSLTITNVGATNAGSYSVVVSNAFGSVTSLNASLTLFTPPSSGCVSYPNFNSPQGLTILHDASVVGPVLRLTTSEGNQTGTAWYVAKVFCAQGFTSSFQFQITDPGGLSFLTPGADGISFSVQNASLSLDPNENSTSSNGFGISLNTFQDPGEVSGNFVGICTNGVNWILQQDLDPAHIQLKDGKVHTALVEYNGATISVSIDTVAIITNFPVALAPALDANGMGWVGFGARTGGAWENHDILNWEFCSPQPTSGPYITSQPVSQAAVPGGTANFSVAAGGQPPLAYQWLFQGMVVPGATNASYTLSNVASTNVGSYSVVVSNAGGWVTSSNAMLGILTPSASDCLNYPNFASTNGLLLLHDAFITTNSALRLTGSTSNQVGTAWYAVKVPCAQGFTSTFQFQITDLGGLPFLDPGADGISFSLQNAGLNVDPNETSVTSNGFGISFNTFWNPSFGEVSGNFVGICTNGENWVMEHDLSSTPIRLKDGNMHTAVIQYDGAMISVSIDSLAVITNYAVALTPALDTNGMSWVGLGARTGGSWENHDILSWSFCSLTNNSAIQTTLPGNLLVALRQNDMRNRGSFTGLTAHLDTGVLLELMGIPGKTYTIQGSTDLMHWETLGTATADQMGNLGFKDTTSANVVSRYYRAASSQ